MSTQYASFEAFSPPGSPRREPPEAAPAPGRHRTISVLSAAALISTLLLVLQYNTTPHYGTRSSAALEAACQPRLQLRLRAREDAAAPVHTRRVKAPPPRYDGKRRRNSQRTRYALRTCGVS